MTGMFDDGDDDGRSHRPMLESVVGRMWPTPANGMRPLHDEQCEEHAGSPLGCLCHQRAVNEPAIEPAEQTLYGKPKGW